MNDNRAIPKLPTTNLASEAWVSERLAELELLFERRLHQQTKYFLEQLDAQRALKQSSLLLPPLTSRPRNALLLSVILLTIFFASGIVLIITGHSS
jgi:hypothetical protein